MDSRKLGDLAMGEFAPELQELEIDSSLFQLKTVFITNRETKTSRKCVKIIKSSTFLLIWRPGTILKL